jgi:phage-related protein
MLKAIGSVLGPIYIPMFKVLMQVIRVIWEVLKVVFNISIGIIKVIASVINGALRLLSILTGSSTTLESILNRMMEFVTGLQVTFSLFSIYIDGLVAEISNAIKYWVDGIAGAFKTIGREIEALWSKYGKYIQAILSLAFPQVSQNIKNMQNMGAEMGKKIEEEGVGEKVSKYAGKAKDWVMGHKADILSGAIPGVKGFGLTNKLADWGNKTNIDKQINTTNNNYNLRINPVMDVGNGTGKW